MKAVFVVALLVAAAAAAPVDSDAQAQILRYDNDNDGVQQYKFAYETSNGISHQEDGNLKNPGTDNEAIEVRGQFAYTGPDGVVYSVSYTADEEGFHPVGAHLPVPPQ